MAKLRKCGKCGGRGHNARTCKKEVASKSKSKTGRKCGKCGGRGHDARNCKGNDSAPEAQPAKVAIDTPSVVTPIKRPSIKHKPDVFLPPEEKRARKREGVERVQLSRQHTVARCVRWIRREHSLTAKQALRNDLKAGREIGLVSTQQREPISFAKARILKVDGETVSYKIKRDITTYQTDFDYILNYKVPGRSTYYVVW